MNQVPLDLLTATLREIVDALAQGLMTSEALVHAYLARIQAYNHQGPKLHAVIETAPKDLVIARARELDDERKAGRTRGPLHGIPILIKDTIYTDPSLVMQTTAGVNAFVGSKVPGNAPVVGNLLDAGAIIIGKANLTTLGNMYGKGTSNGWSPQGGQTKNPYGAELSPYGSSSGNTVGVATGLCAASVGGETFGSITSPGDVAGLFTFKPSNGPIPTDRVISISFRQDVLGPMGRSVWDIATMISGMTPPSDKPIIRNALLSQNHFRLESYAGQPCQMIFPTERAESFDRAMEILKSAYEQNIKLDSIDLKLREAWNPDGGFVDGEWVVNELSLLLDQAFENPEEDENSQYWLRAARDSQGDKVSKEYQTALKWHKDFGKQVLEYMKEEKLDGLIMPSFARNTPIISSSLGFPIATVPFDVLPNGKPGGIWLMAKPGGDKILLNMMTACEKVFPPRPIPKGFQ